MAPRATQLKGVAFMKIGIVDKFPKYAQNHIKRKEKKEAKEKLPLNPKPSDPRTTRKRKASDSKSELESRLATKKPTIKIKDPQS